jgi:hypothetical protein
MLSPEKSTKVTSPGDVPPGEEIATANFCGCAAGPTGLMALTTGRYVLPQPATSVSRVAARANLDVARTVWGAKAGKVKVRGAKTWTTNRKGLRRGRDCVLAAASILAKCKTAPTLLLVLTKLKA